jgi:pyruvate dehydrogenase (quinone)
MGLFSKDKLGTRPSQEALEGCDTLLIVGSSFPYVEFYPKPGKTHAVQIDRDPERIGLRHPVECGLVGGACETLHALLPRSSRGPTAAFSRRRRREWPHGARCSRSKGRGPTAR